MTTYALSYTEISRPFVAIILIALALSTVWIYRGVFHPLAKVPGPTLARYTGLWRDWQYFKGNWHDVVLDLHAKYGRVVRVAPDELSLVDEKAMKKIYGHGTGNNSPKTEWYSTWDIPKTAPGLFATQDQKEHAFLRKRVAGAYSMTTILKVEEIIQSCFDLLFTKLKEHSNEVVNMSEWTNAVAYDVVGELAYGEQLGHLATETDVMGVRKAIFDGFIMMGTLGHFKYFGRGQTLNRPSVGKITKLLGIPNAFAKFRQWSIERVNDRRKNPVTRHDMLNHFLQMKAKDGSPASDGEVLIEAMNIVGAGADTTSIGMRACLYYVCSNPLIYRKLQAELDEYFLDREAKGIPASQGSPYNEIRQLPYLHAVISEATRLHPSIMWQLLRKAPQDLTVDGFTIPPGTNVGISPRAQNRDPDIWGEDANEFRPERWIEDEEKGKYFENTTMTFGGNGPRMCIGRNIALVEMHKYIAQLLCNFDVQLVDPSRPWHITTYWFAYQHEMKVRVKVREGRMVKT
ncbi:hypothetical protein N7504_011108 [Penicillium tannophilum]|nr:hypothetical protein N7504_011108 [Penicillium tannophilum]